MAKKEAREKQKEAETFLRRAAFDLILQKKQQQLQQDGNDRTHICIGANARPIVQEPIEMWRKRK